MTASLFLLLSACGMNALINPPSDEGDDPQTLAPGDDTDDSAQEDVDPITLLDPATLPQGPEPCRAPVLVEVYRIVDGDTIYVTHADGSGVNEKVRIIGVDTPEVAHSSDETSECYGDEAATYTDRMLYGKTIWLSFDRTCEDAYDRTLAYVLTGGTEDDLFERHLLREGYATAYPWSNTDTFEGIFDDDEAYAQDVGAGLWSECD